MKLQVVTIFILSAVLLIMASTDDQLEVKWANYKIEYGKFYASEEEENFRKANFFNLEKEIQLHNSIENRELTTFTRGHNHLSDLTVEERNDLLGFIPPPENHDIPKSFYDETEDDLDSAAPITGPPPSSLDLRTTTKCIGPVKNQHVYGRCGSCWVFCSIAPVEFGYCMARNQTYVSLSEQQVIDCSGRGCNGGWSFYSWNYLISAGGSDPTSFYPYLGPKAHACTFSLKNVVAKVVGYNHLPRGNVSAIVAAMIQYGPISVGMQVNAPFGSYKSGVYSDPSCTCTKTKCPSNHCMTAVGYGTDPVSKKDYWIIRNSWGTAWGIQGYILVQKGVNMCGVENFASYVIAK